MTLKKHALSKKILPICVLITIAGTLSLRTIFKGSVLIGGSVYKLLKKFKKSRSKL